MFMEIPERIAIAGFPPTVRPNLGWILAAVAPQGLPAALTRALDDTAAQIRTCAPAQLPAIAATRAAYRALGKDPARYRPAAEALRRRICRGEPPPRIDPRVEVGTLLSLKSGFSIGVYDADRLHLPLCFRPGAPGERYAAIGGLSLNLEGLPVLADQNGPFGSPTRDSCRTAVGPQTQRVLFVLFGFAPEPVTARILTCAQDSLKRYLDAQILASDLAA